MKHVHPTKIYVFSTCLLLITAFAISDQTISTQQQEAEWYAEPMNIAQQIEPYAIYAGYTPSQIKTAYNLPSTGGNGTTIAIIIAFDAPTILTDLTVFCSQFNLPAPTSNNFEIHKMAQDIDPDSGWAQEASLDVEWAHAIAPEAKILLVEAVSNSQTNLLAAIDYAKSRSDVVAISMSWGSDEPSNPVYLDSKLVSSYGAVFFAASGDEGAADSDTVLCWPASSSNVVAVGGTTLNLNWDGTVISETAWSGSGGGASEYEKMPTYQANYGLNGTKRIVPDVGYNANPSTGVPVYCNGNWYKVGGTSAGAPQWAAIHALGVSASNINLYEKAKSDYQSYFRDITSGSNGYSAGSGYDYVTGLGSPLTFDFGVNVSVTPTSGTAGSTLTLSASGLSGSSVNVSYLNPMTATWVCVSNNTAITSGGFTIPLSAPDLMQCNPSGDNAQSFDSIVFRVTDNSNGRSYNTSTAYNQYRRGLTQIGNSTAQGLYGNSTNLVNSVFVQDGGSLVVGGKWFSPGTATLLWDTTNISTTTIDGTGQFNTSIIIPTSSVGEHTLTIQDSATKFYVNISRSPWVANDYTDSWYTTDYTINLTADYTVNETFYRINDGEVQNVTANGQPKITTESGNNTLEYWSTWSLDGSALMETPHRVTSGIKLDKTAPLGSIMSNSITQTAEITLYLNSDDTASGVAEMHFSHVYGDWTSWEPYSSTKTWTLHGYDGAKTVYVQFRDNAGLVSTYSCVVTFQTPQASPKPLVTVSPTPSPTATQATPSPTSNQTNEPSATPVPEFPVGLALFSLAFAALLIALVVKKNKNR